MRSPPSPSCQAGRVRFVPPAVAVVAFLSAGSPLAAQSPQAEVTFAKDVAPILQQNCQICHQPGSIGPMSLMSYEEVRPWARAIKRQVETREMPPYHYDVDVGIQELKHDKRLSAEQIATIVSWVDAGAPLGDPADMPPPAQFPDPAEWRLAETLGKPDVVVPSTPYDVPASGNDIWWQPLVESGITADRCIRAMEVKPSVDGRAATHHANPYIRERNPDGTPKEENTSSLTEYALGKLGEIVPEDACRIFPANSMVWWDIHYYPPGKEVADNVVELGIWLHPEGHKPKYKQTLRSYALDNGTTRDRMIDLPPNGYTMTQGFHRFDTPVRIDSFQPHGHLRLKAKKMEIIYPDGRRELVSMISNWNPGWHLSHIYEDHVAPLLPVGSTMVLTAWYDNTAENPHNPDPDQWVGWGQRTSDEMSHAWIAVTHLDQEGYDRLMAEREAKKKQETQTGG